MSVGSVTGNKRTRGPAAEPSGGKSTGAEPTASIAKKARLEARKTCETFPDLNTVEGQDAFFNLVGIEGIEQCFRDDLKTVEQVYWMKADELLAVELASAPADPPVRIDPSYFKDAQTQRVPGDGNCLMHSVFAAAENLGGDTRDRIPSSPSRMRKLVVKHVEREFATWHDKPVNDIPDEKQYVRALPRDDRERRRMLERLETSGVWDEDILDLGPSAIADALNVRIEVITPYTDDEHRLVVGPDDPDLPLLVLLRRGAHYEPVVKKSAVQHRQHIRPELALVQHVHHAGRREHEDQRREEPGHRGE